MVILSMCLSWHFHTLDLWGHPLKTFAIGVFTFFFEGIIEKNLIPSVFTAQDGYQRARLIRLRNFKS